MQSYLASAMLVLIVVLVISRVLVMKRRGIRAMNFGKLDKKDFLIPPFALLYFYLVFSHTFNWPLISKQEMFNSEIISWMGVLFCFVGCLLFVLSLISFGDSFRVGIDIEDPDQLVTTGIYAISRNPIYLAFWIILLVQFFVFPNWILLLYLGGATWLFQRQVLREEEYLNEHYGKDFVEYCSRVRRYL